MYYAPDQFDVNEVFDLIAETSWETPLDSNVLDAHSAYVLSCGAYDDPQDPRYQDFFDRVAFDDYADLLDIIICERTSILDALTTAEDTYPGDPWRFYYAVSLAPELIAPSTRALYEGTPYDIVSQKVFDTCNSWIVLDEPLPEVC